MDARIAIPLAAAAAALVALPATAQRPGDPLSLRDPTPRPYERAYAWYPYAPIAGDEQEHADRPALLLFGSTGGTGLNPTRLPALDPGFRPPPSLTAAEPASAGAAFVGYRLDRWTLVSGVRQGLDAAESTQGTRIDVGASYGFNINPRHLITLAGALTVGQANAPTLPLGAYASESLNAQSFRAGEPGMGLRLSWTYTLDRNLFVDTSLGYDRLQAGADSRQSFDRATTTFGTTFGYRW